jgi:dihydroorotate dehydrogenase (NAD+) catalytic subunit
MNTGIKIGTLTLKNPITAASGTAGYGEELSRFIDISKIGAIFTKGLSLNPRRGNEGNRIMETPSGVLNSIGLENVGLKEFIDKKLPFLIKSGATVIPNIAGHSIDENIELCRTLSQTKGIAALELNVSCPNVKQGGMAFGTDLGIFTDLVEKVRNVTKCSLIVKLSPNVTDITQFAVRAEEIGADAISAINTLLGMKIDIKKRKPYFKNKVAGLSGPAIKPVAVRIVYQIYDKIKIPVIGMGGINNVEDVVEFMMAGASAVSIGTANMVEPAISEKLVYDLELYMQRESITSIDELIGAAH